MAIILIMLHILHFWSFLLLHASMSNAILEQLDSDVKFIEFSGQILPVGSYRIQIKPFDSQNTVVEEEFVAKTGNNGKFKMELPREQFNGAIYNEIQIAPIYEIETEAHEEKKIFTVKRIVNEPISDEKTYKLYYGALLPSNKNDMNHWYLYGLIIDPPSFLDRWDDFDENFQPIQVQSSARQFCPDFFGSIKALNKHIKLAKVPWWNRPFVKGTPFRVDLIQMVMDSECGAKIGQLGQIEELQIKFEAIPSKLLGWKDQHGPASYTINYPVLSGLDQHGQEFRFDYEFSFFRQTKALEGIRNTGNGPKELLEAWNGLMERIGTMQMKILEKNNEEMDNETKNQGKNNLNEKAGQRSERRRADTGKMEEKSKKKRKMDDENQPKYKENMDEEILGIIDDAIERQTFDIIEEKKSEESPSIAKSVLSMTERLCKALVRKSGLLSYVFEGICVKLLRKCELCTLKRSERDARRKEIDAEHRGIVAEISGLIGVLDKANVLEQFFKKLWGHYVSTMAKWLRNLVQFETNRKSLVQTLRVIFDFRHIGISSEKSRGSKEIIDSSETDFPISESGNLNGPDQNRRSKRAINDDSDDDDDNNDSRPLQQSGRDCAAIRSMAEICDKRRHFYGPDSLHSNAIGQMDAVVKAVDTRWQVEKLWSDAKRMMKRVGGEVVSGLKAMRNRETVGLVIFGAGMRMMVNFIQNTTIRSVRVPVAGFTRVLHNRKVDWQTTSHKPKKGPRVYRSRWVWKDHQKDLWVPWEHGETMAQLEYSKQFWNVVTVSGTIALLLLIWIGTAAC